MFKRLVFSASLSGLFVGLLITLLQSFTVIPMIITAETYEVSDQSVSMGHSDRNHQHDHGHHHDADGWAPSDGFERTFYTALTNILAAIGFALLLAACFSFLEKIDWRKGLLWGVGGFLAFQLAPSIGLPPELPGTEAAALEARQIWWVATAVSTAIGLILLFNTKSALLKISGLLFILIPQSLGAPQPVEHSAFAPQSLITQFIVMTTIIGAIFWLLLGGLTAYAHNKLN